METFSLTGLCVEVTEDWYVDWITMPEEMFSFLKRFCSNGLLKELKAVLLVRGEMNGSLLTRSEGKSFPARETCP